MSSLKYFHQQFWPGAPQLWSFAAFNKYLQQNFTESISEQSSCGWRIFLEDYNLKINRPDMSTWSCLTSFCGIYSLSFVSLSYKETGLLQGRWWSHRHSGGGQLDGFLQEMEAVGEKQHISCPLEVSSLLTTVFSGV